MTVWCRRFWADAAERAAKSAAQAAVLVLPADRFDVLHADWRTVVGFAAGGAVLSLFTSVASSRVGSTSSASLLPPG